MSMLSSLTIIFLIVGLLIPVACVGLAILCNIKRGHVRALYSLGITIVSFILALFGAPALSKLFAGLYETVKQFICSTLMPDGQTSEIMNSELVSNLLTELPRTIAAVELFTVIFLVSELIGTIVLAIVVHNVKKSGTDYFDRKRGPTGWISAACGLVAGLVLFLVISMPFNFVLSSAADFTDVAESVSDTDDTYTVIFSIVKEADESPAHKVSIYMGEKIILSQLTKANICGEEIRFSEETENISGLVKDIVNLSNLISEEVETDYSTEIRRLCDDLDKSNFIAVAAKEIICIYAANAENELIKEFSEIWKNVEAEDFKTDIRMAADIVCDIFEKDYGKKFISVFSESENDGTQQTKDSFEELSEILKDMSSDGWFSDVMVKFSENDRMKKLLPCFFDTIFETVGEGITEEEGKQFSVNPELAEIGEEDAKELGGAVDEMVLTIFDAMDSFEEINNNFTQDAEKIIKILESSSFEKLYNSYERVTGNKYIGECCGELFDAYMNEFAEMDLTIFKDVFSGKLTFSEAVESVKKLFKLSTSLSGENVTNEEKQEIVRDYVENVTKKEAEQISGLITPEYVQKLCGVPEEYAATAANLVSGLYSGLATVEDVDGSETEAVKNIMLLAITYGSGETKIGEGAVIGDAEKFVETIASSKAVAVALEAAKYDENGEIKDDPMGVGNLMTESERDMLKKATDKYESQHDLSETERKNIENMKILLDIS